MADGGMMILVLVTSSYDLLTMAKPSGKPMTRYYLLRLVSSVMTHDYYCLYYNTCWPLVLALGSWYPP